MRWVVRPCTQVYQDEPHVDDVKGVRFEWQGLCQDIEPLELKVWGHWASKVASKRKRMSACRFDSRK